MRTLLALLLTVSMLAAACGQDVPPDTPDTPPASEAPEPEPEPEPAPPGATYPALPSEIREIQPDVVDAQPRPFERARTDETDGSLWVAYWTGVEPCYVLGAIEVDASDDRVTVTLHEGHVPDADGEPPVCIMLAVEVAVRIPMDAPLGDRILIDGATGDEVPVERITIEDAPAS
jgi:hypothetical protein